MPTFHLPAKPAVAAAIAAGVDVPGRLTEVAESAGYVIGEGGIQVYPDGRVTIDADRDPTAQWLAWDPAIPTRQEQQDVALREAIAEARAGLQQIVAIAGGSGNLTQAQIKTGLGRLAGTLDDLIGLLDRRGFMEGS